jgi:hypothetical protein
MQSVLGIYNSALAKVGCSPVSAVDDGSREATLITSIYEQKRDEVMAAHPWHGCVKRAVWSPDSVTPEFEYSYRYPLPTDCLRVLSDQEDEEFMDADWVVEGRYLLTNYETINVRYIWRNTDVSSWSPQHAETLAWRIAQEIAYALTQSSDREQKCADNFRKALAEARSANGAEGTPKALVVDYWTRARR